MIIRYQEDLANIMPVTTELPMAPMVATARPVPVQVFIVFFIGPCTSGEQLVNQ